MRNLIVRFCLLLAAIATPLMAAAAQTRPMPPSTEGWYIVLYDQETYRGASTNYDRAIARMTGRAVRSITIGQGRWDVCEGANYSGRCVTLDRNTPNLRDVNLRRVGSMRPNPGRPAPAPGPEGPYIVLFDQTKFRGSPRNFDGVVSDTRWDARVRSITIGRGVWEICEGVNFGGRCAVLEKSEPDLSRKGFRGRIGSVRPARATR